MDMRDMTPEELRLWGQGKWPCGHNDEGDGMLHFMRGPSGGAMVNLFCPVCDLGLCVIDPECAQSWWGLSGKVIRQPVGYVPPPEPPPPPVGRWAQLKQWFKTNFLPTL